MGNLTGTYKDLVAGGGVVLFFSDIDFPSIIDSSTITDNQALGSRDFGGGIATDGGIVQLHNTIVADNSAVFGPDAFGSFDSTYSIIENQMDVVFNSGSATAGSPNSARWRTTAAQPRPTRSATSAWPTTPAIRSTVRSTTSVASSVRNSAAATSAPLSWRPVPI